MNQEAHILAFNISIRPEDSALEGILSLTPGEHSRHHLNTLTQARHREVSYRCRKTILDAIAAAKDRHLEALQTLETT